MKGKYTLNRLLHNNKLMIAFSVIAAIAIWASVVYGTTIPELGSIKVDVPLDLSKSYPGSKGLKNFSETSKPVEVEIKGSRAVVKGGVQPSDIKVTPDFNVIYGPGDYEVQLKYSKSSTSKQDFDIIGINPDTVKIHADYELRKSLPVETDISGITVKDTANTYLGTPKIDDLENNTIQIIGPQTDVSKIVTIVAKVDKQESISETQNYPATLVAYDSEKNEVDLKYCSFVGLEQNKLTVLVPVNIHRIINFTLNSFDFKNIPAAYKNNGSFCAINPTSVELIGPPDQIETYAKSIEKEGAVGAIDFSHIGPANTIAKVPLNLPQGIREKSGITEISLSFDIQDYASKTLNVPVTNTNFHLQNAVPNVTVPQQTISVTIVGPVDTITKIKEPDISFTADMGNNSKVGTQQLLATVQIPGYNDVWAYYSDNANGYPVFVTVS